MIVTDETGQPLQSQTLRVRSQIVDDDTVHAVRTLAYANGRVLERDGLSILAIDVASRVVFPEGVADSPQGLSALLKDILDQSARGTTAPIAIAALPYDLDAYNEFIVAKITVIQRGADPAVAIFLGTEMEIASLEGRNLIAEASTLGLLVNDPPDHFALEAVIAHEEFREKVAAAVRAIADGQLGARVGTGMRFCSNILGSQWFETKIWRVTERQGSLGVVRRSKA